MDGFGGIEPNKINFSSYQSSGKQLDPLIKKIASRLAISEFTAFKLLRKFMGTANAGNYSEIEDFISKLLKESTPRQIEELSSDLKVLEQKTNATEKDYKPVLNRLKYGLEQSKQANQDLAYVKPGERFALDRFSGNKQAQAPNPNLANQLVKSPKEFASWLVNNKAAFIALKANPQATNLLLALQNPNITKSPVLLSQLTALIVQLIKLKANKSQDIDEKRKEDFDKEQMIADNDHEHHIVNNVKAVASTTTVGHVKDFLLEAERFAEEEIANLWSLTLKKEKELEKKLKSEFDKFRKKKD